MNVSEILKDLGYRLSDDGEYYRTRPLYRDSDNNTSLMVHKSTGRFKDWSTGECGSLAMLVKMTSGFSFDEAYKLLEGKNFDLKKAQEFVSTSLAEGVEESFSMNGVGTLYPNHKHFLDRGISLETLAPFGGGQSMAGYMRNRYAFPVFDLDERIVGFSGRALLDGMKPKWKHKGKTRNWLYPLFVNQTELETNDTVILVESIGDMLALWENGIRNVIVLFGVKISKRVLAEVIRLNPKRILVSLNNEPDNENIGNDAAAKITEKIACFIDNVEVCLPFMGDFCDMHQEGTIQSWIEEKL